MVVKPPLRERRALNRIETLSRLFAVVIAMLLLLWFLKAAHLESF